MTRKNIITILILSIAILIAIITRGYKLGSAPAGLYLDEAGQGYSAYSILKTGKDEFGKSFPIVFRSFTDFKTPVYVYLIEPLIPIFGLTKFAVRFPSFLFKNITVRDSNKVFSFLWNFRTYNKSTNIICCRNSWFFS